MGRVMECLRGKGIDREDAGHLSHDTVDRPPAATRPTAALSRTTTKAAFVCRLAMFRWPEIFGRDSHR